MRFQYVCDLFEQLVRLEVRDVPLSAKDKARRYNDTIQKWFHFHHGLITDFAVILSLLFPDKRVDRVYNMGRPRLIAAIADCLGLSQLRSRRLRDVQENEDLSLVVESIVNEHGGGLDMKSLDVAEIDHCFASLAAMSRWSSPKVRNEVGLSTSRNQRDILRPIVTRMRGRDVKWFIRILFKNLDPLQISFNTTLKVAHPLLPTMMRVREAFTDALELANNAELRTYLDHGHDVGELPSALLMSTLKPYVGCKIGRPRFIKARSFQSCAELVGRRRWALEPKYDGEYCQLHVDLSRGQDCIQIFSKSGKDSTKDRQAAHDWIKSVLQIGSECRFKKQCILEGEIIVLDTRTNRILEFDKIRKHVSRSGSFLGTAQDSAPHDHEHLRIIFYDALLIDDDVLIHQSYETRRKKLSKVCSVPFDFLFKEQYLSAIHAVLANYSKNMADIQQLLPSGHGWACRGSWGSVDFSFSEFRDPRARQKFLQHHFRKARMQRLEGLVLKPLDGSYLSLLPQNDSNYDGTIIKMKADYIPGMGDTADFVIVGAFSSSAHKIEHNLLKQIKWTHFELACIVNKDNVHDHNARPVFRLMGAVSRPAVSADNMRLLSQQGQLRQVSHDHSESGQMPYEIQLANGHTRPKALFERPFIVDVLGSGFERPANTSHYMLRHPRITKVHNDDRGIEDTVSFGELQRMAEEARAIPEDVLKEEQMIMCQIRDASKPKHPQRVEQRSPMRQTASNTTPETANTGSTRTPSVPLVRMDSCEMRPGDDRFVSPLAGGHGADMAQRTEAALTENAQSRKRTSQYPSDGSPPKKRLIEHSQSNVSRRMRNKSPLQERPQKQLDVSTCGPTYGREDVSGIRCQAMRKSTVNVADTGNGSRDNVRSVIPIPNASASTPEVLSHPSKQCLGRSESGPKPIVLVNNKPPELAKSNGLTRSYAHQHVSPPKLRCVERSKSFAFGETSTTRNISPLKRQLCDRLGTNCLEQNAAGFQKGQIFDINVLQGQDYFGTTRSNFYNDYTHPSLLHSRLHNLPNSSLHDLAKATSYPTHNMSQLAAFWNRSALPKALSKRAPLKANVVLLAPEISGYKGLADRLIPLFGASVEADLNHWQRDRRPLAGKKGAVVEESQSDQGMHISKE